MAFLEQGPAGCKTMVDNKCLQQAKNFKYLGCEISYENEKIFNKKIEQILENLSNTFKTTLVQKSSRIKVYNALIPPFFYIEVKFGLSKK